MKLYKLRPLKDEGLFYTLDMIIHERLFLATRELMNDINEGQWNNQFRITGKENGKNQKLVTEFKELIDKQRFTCFVSSIENHLMWAHYADGFSGVALEYELDVNKYDLRMIDYIGIPTISVDQANRVLSGEFKPQDIGVLKQKEKCWGYEGEWRLFGNSANQFIENVKPIRVILGARQTKYADLLENTLGKFDLEVKFMVPSSNTEFIIED